MTNGIKTIVTSMYELRYIDVRGNMIYKSFPLLTETIRNIIFPEYEYIIYTDEFTLNKYSIKKEFNLPNIQIKIEELNSEHYLKNINPIRKINVGSGEIYERIYAVENYMEVMLNKFKFLLNESNGDGSIIWIDSGLFGTSCHDGWRDYMRDNLVYGRKFFLDKIFEKIESVDFFTLRGNGIVINYEDQDRINKIAGGTVKIIPGGLFGGKKSKVKEILSNYNEVFLQYVNEYQKLITDQEVLGMLTYNKNVKFYDFNDWTDLQKSLLKIMDLYDETKYKMDKCYEQ